MNKILDIQALSALAKKLNKNCLVIVDTSFLSPYNLVRLILSNFQTLYLVLVSFLFPQKPLELGADVSLCSLTKYINGHADVTMGAISTNNEKIHKELRMLQISEFNYVEKKLQCSVFNLRILKCRFTRFLLFSAIGATPSPMDCYLTMRGLKTLGCRMRQHMDSAFKVAHFLSDHSMVEKVLFPGLLQITITLLNLDESSNKVTST